MARIHEDRFSHGDVVTWRDEDKATATNGRNRFGNYVTIKETRSAMANARSTGHTQFVTLMEDPDAGFGLPLSREGSYYSGAYFRHLAPWEKT